MGNLFTKAQPIVSNSESIREQNSNLGLDGILNGVLNYSLEISSLKYCLMHIKAINIGKKSAEIAWKMILEKLSYLKASEEITEAVAVTAMSENYKIPTKKEQFQDYILQISKDTTNIERSDMDFTPLEIRNILLSLQRNYSNQIENGLTPEHALNTSFQRLILDVRTIIAIKKQIPIETIDLEIDKNKIDKVISTMVPRINTITTMINPI